MRTLATGLNEHKFTQTTRQTKVDTNYKVL